MLQGGGGQTLLRIWEGCGEKFHFSRFFHKKLKRAIFFYFFNFFFKNLKMFYVLAASGRGGSPGKYSFSAIGGSKIPPPFPLPLPTYGRRTRKRAYTYTREKKSAYTYCTRPPPPAPPPTKVGKNNDCRRTNARTVKIIKYIIFLTGPSKSDIKKGPFLAPFLGHKKTRPNILNKRHKGCY